MSTERDTVNIIYASNDGYARHLAASLYSLLAHSRRIPSLEIWVLSAGMCGEYQDRLRRTARHFKRELHVAELGDLRERFPYEVDTRGFDISAMGRIFAPEVLPEKMERALEDKERIQWFAAKYANAKDAYLIGRGIDYAICLEGSLKMKEISYIHSEAYAAGELKHGTISLIEDGTLVIGVLTQEELYEKTLSNLVEVKSRGAYLMGLTSYGNYEIEDTVNFTVYTPKTDPHFATSLAIIPLQLLGYYLSVARGLDVDKPRNLAKSVTVE